MATKTMLPLEVYDRTSYEPDREYVDGDLKETSTPGFSLCLPFTRRHLRRGVRRGA